jgi:hypothetical protein
MGYEEAWNVLDDLITEIRKKGETIPKHVMNDLHSAKTMIQILKADSTHVENLSRVETYLENVESNLMFTAQEKFGADYVERWMKKLDEARKAPAGEGKTPSKFIVGIPRGEHWVRIQISEETSKSEIERLAKENGLSCKMQKNGYMLVYGDVKKVKEFVKNIAKKFHVKRKQESE